MKRVVLKTEHVTVSSESCPDVTNGQDKDVWTTEQVLKMLNQNSEESFLLTDSDFKIVSFNTSFRDLYANYLNKELTVGSYVLDYSTPERLELVRAIFTSALQGEIQTSEVEYSMPDGVCVYYHNKYKPAFDESGTIIGVFVIVTNMTEQKRAERLLIQSETKFRALIENSSEMIFLSDAQRNIVYASPSVEKILGYKIEDFIGHRGMTFILPENQETMISISEKLMQDPGTIYPMHLQIKSKDGRILWIEGTTVNLLNDPDISAIVTNFKDITHRKLAEDKLMKLHLQLQTSQHIARLGYWGIDLQGNENFLSEEMYAICEQEVNDPLFTVETFRGMVHPDDIDLFDRNHQEAVKHGNSFRNEFRLVMADGRHKIVLSNGAMVKNIHNKPLLEGTLQDITQLKQTETALLVLNEELQKRAKELSVSNAELEQFAYIASHDLQEPLRMITSFLSQLEKKYTDKLDDKGRQYIHFATDGAVRMRQIILDLLEFSRVGKTDLVQFEAVDLNILVREAIDLNKALISDIKAVIRVDTLPRMNIRKPLLRQVFQNLINNALKYRESGKHTEIHIGVSEQPDAWTFSVKDNGIGINPKFFDKVFILFQRLHHKDQYSGTGIGLALCKKIVEGNGGRIWIESEEGNGTTFFFTLKKKQEPDIKVASE